MADSDLDAMVVIAEMILAGRQIRAPIESQLSALATTVLFLKGELDNAIRRSSNQEHQS